jgi:anti-anti-sigma factor
MRVSDFAYDERRRGDVAEVALSGELDMQATFRLEPALDRLLDSGDVRELVLDLRDVRFVDSSGVGLIVETYERGREAHTDIALVPGRPEVQRVFQVTGLADVLPFRSPE